jgi:drug/metabolite transporter (DMT)-like permease
MKNTAAPLILVLFGIAWLLHELGWKIEWEILGAGALVIAGALVLILEGLTKSSVVNGPMLVFAGGAWYAHHERVFSWNLILPTALIVLGLCLVLSRVSNLPVRRGARADRADRRPGDVPPGR